MRKMGLFWFAAALLGAALIFSGCPTEADTETKYVSGEMIHLDVVVSTLADLRKALAMTDDLAIGLDGEVALDWELEIGAGKALYILSGGKLETGGENLTVAGIVYVGIEGELDASGGNVIVTSGGISVLSKKTVAGIIGVVPGTLTVSASANVNDGVDTTTTVLGTDKVRILGTLKYDTATDVDTADEIKKVLGYVEDGGELDIDISAITPTAAVTLAVSSSIPTGKTLTIQADGADTTTTELTIPAGLFLKTSTALSAVDTVTVAEGGGFYATSTSSAFPAAGIGLVADGAFYATSTLKFKDDSSVGENGYVALVDGATFETNIKLTVANGSLVYFGATNNVWFPAAADITGITDEELTIGSIEVPAGEALAVEGGTLVLATDAVLTLNKGAAIWGAVKAGATTISGGGPPDAGGWRATSDDATVITATAATTATITGGVLSGGNGSVITQAAGATLTVESSVKVGALILGAGDWKATNAAATISADTLTLGSHATATFGTATTSKALLTGTAVDTNTFTASGTSATVTLSQDASNNLEITGSGTGAALAIGAGAGITVNGTSSGGLTITGVLVDISTNTASIKLAASGDVIKLGAGSKILLDDDTSATVDITNKAIKTSANAALGTAGAGITVNKDSGSVILSIIPTDGETTDTTITSGATNAIIVKGIKIAS